ncbi:MAG TPA: hypothetical protein PKD54_02375 [Pirellulaceae bacterium]|nr:hypothetical protein [Pirellulaceae bacterium]
MKRFAIVLACSVMSIAGCNQGKDEVAKKVESVTDAAKEALDAVKDFKLGDVDLREKFQGISVAIQQEVMNITDVESAKATLPKFEEALGQLKQLKEMFGKLPDNVRAALAKIIGTETVTLRGIMEVAEENYGEGVGPVVNKVFESIRKELEGFK